MGAFIPFLGNILGTILQGVLMGGYFWLLLKLIRGKEAEIVDAFSGFNLAFVQLMLAGIVTTILAALPVFIAVIAFMGSFFMAIFSAASRGDIEQFDPSMLVGAMGVVGVVGILIALLISIILNIWWVFSLPLVIDKKLNFWKAMELSRKVSMKAFFSLLGLLILGGLIAMLGILGCCVGVFVTAPVMMGAIAYAYEDIFGASSPETS